MSVIMVTGCKGGAGKSTIATNLAVYFARQGVDVMLLDTDPQRTSTRFVERRDEAGIEPVVHCTQRTGNIYKTVCDLAGRYELVIIDAGGRHDGEEIRTGLVSADVAIVPVRASQADLETLEKFEELVGLARGLNPALRANVILSMTPTHYLINEAILAREAIAQFQDLGLSSCTIYERKAYRDALLDGQGVVERATPAKAEIQLLGQEVERLIGGVQ